MATLKFAKLASRIVIRETSSPEKKASSNDVDVNNLKNEVKFLKDILHLKKFGGGYSELVYKVKLLQQENESLRRTQIPEMEVVDELIRQNQVLKRELKNIRTSTRMIVHKMENPVPRKNPSFQQTKVINYSPDPVNTSQEPYSDGSVDPSPKSKPSDDLRKRAISSHTQANQVRAFKVDLPQSENEDESKTAKNAEYKFGKLPQIRGFSPLASPINKAEMRSSEVLPNNAEDPLEEAERVTVKLFGQTASKLGKMKEVNSREFDENLSGALETEEISIRPSRITNENSPETLKHINVNAATFSDSDIYENNHLYGNQNEARPNYNFSKNRTYNDTHKTDVMELVDKLIKKRSEKKIKVSAGISFSQEFKLKKIISSPSEAYYFKGATSNKKSPYKPYDLLGRPNHFSTSKFREGTYSTNPYFGGKRSLTNTNSASSITEETNFPSNIKSSNSHLKIRFGEEFSSRICTEPVRSDLPHDSKLFIGRMESNLQKIKSQMQTIHFD